MLQRYTLRKLCRLLAFLSSFLPFFFFFEPLFFFLFKITNQIQNSLSPPSFFLRFERKEESCFSLTFFGSPKKKKKKKKRERKKKKKTLDKIPLSKLKKKEKKKKRKNFKNPKFMYFPNFF
ncbi:hypothetical protein llap_17191 [Limosa lapponica baueri]|uniref:Uncharacterized protein n=1 Tax=Limosa lapponica baueri TaxID=1758121 RepID=A0A2I0TFC7_LIMLA|nr:hypothetical protein llap_17191 [Limosa lapponica baueri]